MEELLVRLLNGAIRWSGRLRQWRRRQPDAGSWLVGTRAASGLQGEAGLVRLEDTALDRHLYVLGGTGTGKTKLLELLIRQHFQRGAGLAVIDPHGDLVQSLLRYLCDEAARATAAGTPLDLDRIWVVAPSDEEGIIGLNPLDASGGSVPVLVGELIGIFRRLWAASWGPRMEDLLRHCLLTLAAVGLTLVEVEPFLTDAAFRARVLERVPDETIRGYWAGRYEPRSAAAQATLSEPILNKMGALLADRRLRAMLGQREHSLHLRRLMDAGAWVLVDCARGQLREASYLLGSFVVAQLEAAALSRADQSERERRPFTVFVDEFQSFRGDDFETMLCESRKYRLRLVVAHQHLGQLDPALQNAIFGNVGTHLFFAVSPQDAAVLAKGLLNGASMAPALAHLPVGHALLHRRGQPAVQTRILPVLTPPVPAAQLDPFTAQLRQQHGRSLRRIETEIRRRRAALLAPTTQPVARKGGRRKDTSHPETIVPPVPPTGHTDRPVQEADDA